MFFMEPEHFRVVHFIDVVSRQHEHMRRCVLFDHINILIDGVRRALVPFVANPLLGGDGDDVFVQFSGKEVPGHAQVLVQRERFILRKDRDLPDAGIDAVRKGKINDTVDTAEGDRRFCPVNRERVEPFALPPARIIANMLISLHAPSFT